MRRKIKLLAGVGGLFSSNSNRESKELHKTEELKQWQRSLLHEISDNSQLFDLLRNNSVSVAKEVIEQGNSKEQIQEIVNKTDDLGSTLAIIAAEANDLEMLRWLATRGAKLDVSDNSGRTPVGWAMKHGNEEMKKFIETWIEENTSEISLSK